MTLDHNRGSDNEATLEDDRKKKNKQIQFAGYLVDLCPFGNPRSLWKDLYFSSQSNILARVIVNKNYVCSTEPWVQVKHY